MAAEFHIATVSGGGEGSASITITDREAAVVPAVPILEVNGVWQQFKAGDQVAVILEKENGTIESAVILGKIYGGGIKAVVNGKMIEMADATLKVKTVDP